MGWTSRWSILGGSGLDSGGVDTSDEGVSTGLLAANAREEEEKKKEEEEEEEEKKAAEEKDDVASLVSSIKSFTGLWPDVDPEDSEWFKLVNQVL